MKNLIINADDLGADEGRNAGILEAVEAGAVKSVSLLVNAPATGQALEDIRQGKYEWVSIGVHLNLSEGKPVCPDLRLLPGSGGFFRGKAAAQRLFLRENDLELEEEVSREVKAQVGALREKNIPLTHLDGHQHLHVFPAVRKAAIGAAREYGIPWVRIPHEPLPVSEDGEIPEDLKSEAKLFSGLGGVAARLWRGAGVRAADHFRGLYFKGRLGSRLLEKVLERLPEGVTELMVHPGRVSRGSGGGPFSGFSTIDRERELEALLSPTFRRAVLLAGVRLTSFGEVLS
jgi:predicted glycoside hydrolase/deacetylase ChbG (UPF0249 family)